MIPPGSSDNSERYGGDVRHGQPQQKSVCLDLKVDEERAIFLDRSNRRRAHRELPPRCPRHGARLKPCPRPARTRLCLDLPGTARGRMRTDGYSTRSFRRLPARLWGGEDRGERPHDHLRQGDRPHDCASVTAALLERARTGLGQYLPITMLESALSYQWPDVVVTHLCRRRREQWSR